jgi:hypothetical protein
MINRKLDMLMVSALCKLGCRKGRPTAADELTPHPSNPFEPSMNPTMPCKISKQKHNSHYIRVAIHNFTNICSGPK